MMKTTVVCSSWLRGRDPNDIGVLSELVVSWRASSTGNLAQGRSSAAVTCLPHISPILVMLVLFASLGIRLFSGIALCHVFYVTSHV